MAEITTKLQTPSVPNYILHDVPVRSPIAESPKTDIADLSDDVLRQIGAEWTEALIARARVRRGQAVRED